MTAPVSAVATVERWRPALAASSICVMSRASRHSGIVRRSVSFMVCVLSLLLCFHIGFRAPLAGLAAAAEAALAANRGVVLTPFALFGGLTPLASDIREMIRAVLLRHARAPFPADRDEELAPVAPDDGAPATLGRLAARLGAGLFAPASRLRERACSPRGRQRRAITAVIATTAVIAVIAVIATAGCGVSVAFAPHVIHQRHLHTPPQSVSIATVRLPPQGALPCVPRTSIPARLPFVNTFMTYVF